jgi:hypothetical protein
MQKARRLQCAHRNSAIAAALLLPFACTDDRPDSDAPDFDAWADRGAPDSNAPADIADPAPDTGNADFDQTATDAPYDRTIDLFNGKDFTGWDTYLGPPYGSQEPLGLNRDPDGVFSIVMVDGSPAVHISGQDWGALTTVEEFENYHLHLEFKWGTHAIWPPLTSRDSGLMYHSIGPFGAVARGGGNLASPPGSGYFMTSMELQIAANDLGSYYSLGPITVDGGAFSAAAVGQFENPLGTWNTIDVYVVGNESVQVVNEKRVVHVRGAEHDDGGGARVPLTRGKLQLESESMEIFFRAIMLTPIDHIPNDLL